MKFPRTYDATITRGDFVRLLAQATGQDDFVEHEGVFRGLGWTVILSPIAPLSIGVVRLERHRVDIRLEGMTAEAEDRFMQRFTLHYQRGGG